MQKKLNLKILAIFLVWVSVLMFFLYTGTARLNLNIDTAYDGIQAKYEQFSKLAFPANFLQRWDGNWYVGIAKDGYYWDAQKQSNVVFFPLYPITIRTTTILFNLKDFGLGGVITSLIFAFLSCLMLFKLAKLEFDEKIANKSLFLMLSFPTSFFLISVYTESLFIFLAISTFYLARQKKWWLAMICGILLTATRVTGLAIILPLIWEFWRQNEYRIKTFLQPKIISILLMPAGFVAYCFFLYQKFGDPLLFLKGQWAWQRNFEFSWLKINDYYNQYWTNFNNICSQDNLAAITTRNIDLIFLVLFIVLIIISWSRLPKIYALFNTQLLIIPLLSAQLLSLPRYILSAFPIFFVLAIISKKDSVYQMIIITSVLFLALFGLMFVNFYWIA